jgi:hypothetical protein
MNEQRDRNDEYVSLNTMDRTAIVRQMHGLDPLPASTESDDTISDEEWLAIVAEEAENLARWREAGSPLDVSIDDIFSGPDGEPF